MLKIDVTEMLNKYYSNLPLFNDSAKIDPPKLNTTPTKRVSFVKIPEIEEGLKSHDGENPRSSISYETSGLDTSGNDKSIHLKMNTEEEVTETPWPNIIKCKYYDV